MQRTIISTKDNGNVIINGNHYQGKVQIIDGRIITDNEILDIDEKIINITVEGSVETIESDTGTITVEGNVDSVSTVNGAVYIKKDAGNVSTINGNVRAEAITNATSVNGNIY